MKRILAACVFLTACQRQPETFAPPIQRQPLEDYRPYGAARLVRMNDADAEAFFTSDIIRGPVDAPWRWTNKHPSITLHPRSVEALDYFIEYSVAEVTLKVTGPVTIKFLVNKQVLHEERIDKSGALTYQARIPAGWLAPGDPALLGAEIDKTYTAQGDGAQLGFLLSSLGLVRGK